MPRDGHDDDDWRGLLLPLADAQDALARLEAAAALASEAVREGLVMRLSLREAAGWLAHHGGIQAHPIDLALRDAGLVGAWGLAQSTERLADAMPATAAADRWDLPDEGRPDDRQVAHALLLARRWRSLAQSAGALLGGGNPEREELRSVLEAIGGGLPVGDGTWHGWLSLMGDDGGLPALLHAARLARAWQQERGAVEGPAGLLSPAALFLAAATWRGRGGTDAMPLPLWSAPATLLHALALRHAGQGWTASLLGIAAAAARRAGAELRHLLEVERRGLGLAAAATARSRLRVALRAALCLPVLTPRLLAARLGVSTRAGLAFAGQLESGGVLREVTGRGAWRAYALAPE